MRKLFLLLTLLVSTTGIMLGAVDEEKPHGRICLSLYEPGPPEKEELFQLATAPGGGKLVRAYVDASEKCTVLVAPMTQDGKLVNGWRPQLAEVPEEFEEILVPKGPAKWEWSAPSGPFDLYVLFLAPGSQQLDDVKKLVEAMGNPSVDNRVLALQAAKLKELIGRLALDKEQTNRAPVSEPEVGGVFRGTAFPWRQFAQAVNFSAEHPGLLILSTDSADKK